MFIQRSLLQGYSANIEVGEESLTDFALVRIATENPLHVSTQKYSRRDEGRTTGADWLWLIGSWGGEWLPLLVQAKVVHPKTNIRSALNYRNGKQDMLFNEFAVRNGLVPLYCVYNSVFDTFVPSTNVRCDLGTEQYACSMLTATQRRRLLGTYKRVRLRHVLEASFPLSALFCCTDRVPRDEWPLAVADALTNLTAADGDDAVLEPALPRLSLQSFLVSHRQMENLVDKVMEAPRQDEDLIPNGVAIISSTPFR